MTLTPDQARAAYADGSVAVTAGAGTGKTHMLTERYLHHLEAHRLRPLQIVAATFTERAAAELRARIRKALAGRSDLQQHAAELEAAQIGTLHSLAARICREHAEAAEVPFDFAIQNELDQMLWLHRHLPEAVAAVDPRAVDGIPYRTLVATLEALLADPVTAKRALEADPGRWQTLIEEERIRACTRITRSSRWRGALATLQEQPGPGGDRIEEQRLAALQAARSLEASPSETGCLLALTSLNLQGGSRKEWGAERLSLVKTACKSLRELAESARYALELELGPPDEALRAVLPGLKEAFTRVSEHLKAVKARERVLDYGDLEAHALRALRHERVCEFYRRRWKAFLIDEFQDTNPVQAELLDALTQVAGSGGAGREETAEALLTVVGDEKQSIYGFRRADLTVFGEVRERISARGGDTVRLAKSFRTHDCLVRELNDLVAPALGELHQPLSASRKAEPEAGPYVSAHLVSDGPRLKQFRQRAEAHLLGELIEELLQAPVTVHDPESGASRPTRPGDIAILARTWDTLGPYGEELAARGVPVIHAGGGSLLSQREAMDGRALLEFLADPSNELGLAAVLRSPFFAAPDRLLLRIAQECAGRGHGQTGSYRSVPVRTGDGSDHGRNRPSWYEALQELAAGNGSESAVLERPAQVLRSLRKRRHELAPSELLELADELTGYSAVISNMPGGPRRLADWRGFRDFVRQLERGHDDVFAVVRELRALDSLEGAKVPRPGIEAGDAVSLMSVHNAKGLEWPVVVLPDITSRGSGNGPQVLFDPRMGVAFRLDDEEQGKVAPALYTILDKRRKDAEEDEEKRVLYVALTRARDRVMITGSGVKGGSLESLREGLEAAGIELSYVPYDQANAVPKTPRLGSAPAAARQQTGSAGSGLRELPVTALGDYEYCPERFRFAHILRHPGAGEGPRTAARLGTLTHVALQRNIRDRQTLRRSDESIDETSLDRALQLAELFRTHTRFAGLEERIERREERLSASLAGMRLTGIADAVGDEFVLDYKTGKPRARAFAMQIGVYARALGLDQGYVAHLDPDEPRLHAFGAKELDDGVRLAEEYLQRLKDGDLAPDPSPEKCGECPFSAICRHSAVSNVKHRIEAA